MSGRRWKSQLRRLLATRAGHTALRFGELLERRSPHHLRILTYHCVDDREGFRAQVAHLAQHWHCVDEAQVIARLEEGTPLPPRAVWITVDDADVNFEEVIWPELRAVGLPATLFVPTAYPDHPERVLWWDRLASALARTECDAITIDGTAHPLSEEGDRRQALRTWKRHAHAVDPLELDRWARGIEEQLAVEPARGRTLSWDRIRALADEGVAIGAHTETHPFLDRLPPHLIAAEIDGSIEAITAALGRTPRTFAYPNGHYSPAVVSAIHASGITLAVTTERGTNDLRDCDRARLRRINIGPDADLATLRASFLRASPIRRSATALPAATGGPRSM